MVGMGSVQPAEYVVALLAEGLALGLGEGAHLADVSPRHEGFLPGAGDDQYTDLLVGLHGVQQLRQIRQHLRIQGVQRLRTVDGGHGIRTFFLQQYVRHNGSSLLWQPPPKQRQRHGKKRFLQGCFTRKMRLLIYLIHYRRSSKIYQALLTRLFAF